MIEPKAGPTAGSGVTRCCSAERFNSFAHDLVRKPVATFRDHAVVRHHSGADRVARTDLFCHCKEPTGPARSGRPDDRRSNEAPCGLPAARFLANPSFNRSAGHHLTGVEPRRSGSVARRQGVTMPKVAMPKSRCKSLWLFVLLLFGGLAVAPVQAADEPDLIFRRSTVFKLLT